MGETALSDDIVRVALAKNPSVTRRTFVRTAAGLVIAAAVGGGAYYYYLSRKPKAVPEVRYESWGGTFQAGIREACLDPFEEEYGIKVVEGSFAGGSDIRAKIKAAGGGEWDVVETDNENGYWGVLDGIWEPLDMDKIPNAEYLPDLFRDPVGAPGLEEGIHYYLLAPVYGTTGLAYNYEKVVPEPTSIAALWDEDYAGKIAPEDYWITRIVHAALYLGEKNINDISDIEAVWEAIREQKPLVVKYWESGTEFETLYETGEAWLGEAWGGRILNMEKAGRAPMRYLIPKEGANTWTEALSIGKNAPHKENAHLLINYMLDPEVQQRISEETMYPPCIEPKNIASLDIIETLPDYVGSEFQRLALTDLGYWTSHQDEWSAIWEQIKAE